MARRRFRLRRRRRFGRRSRRFKSRRRRGFSRMIRSVVLKMSERKGAELTTGDFLVSNATPFNIFSLCSGIPLGTDRDDRIGRRIFVDAIHVSFQATMNPQGVLGSTTDPIFLRVIIGRSETIMPQAIGDLLFSNGAVNITQRSIQYYKTIDPPIKRIYKDRLMAFCEPWHQNAIAFAAGTGTIPAAEQWLGRNLSPLRICRYHIRPRCQIWYDSVPLETKNAHFIYFVASSADFISISNFNVRIRYRDV